MTDHKFRIGAVSYLNTKPLLYGIKQSSLIDRIELTESYPSQLARQLMEDEIDIGLVPVAVLPSLSNWHIVSNYCIGCDGPVASVCLFSEVPINRIQHVLLDYQSRTSAALTKVLLREFWKIDPDYIPTSGEDYRGADQDTTAGLVIGDRAFDQRRRSTYVHDLGEAWKAFTGLPFVFAAWVSNKTLPPDFLEAFDQANELGLSHLPEIVNELDYKLFDLYKYFKYHIDYRFDDRKKLGLQKFLEMISSQ